MSRSVGSAQLACLVLSLLLAAALSGCMATSGDSAPSVSVSYSRSSSDGAVRVSATLTAVDGVDGWEDLTVEGCAAPASGTIEVPHSFTGCTGTLTIKHAPTGETLYHSA